AREARYRGATLLRQAQEAPLRFQLLARLAERAMAASGGTSEGSEIGGGDRVPGRGGNRVHVNAGTRVGHDPEQCEQEPDLRPRVQAGRAREAPWQARGVERAGPPV